MDDHLDVSLSQDAEIMGVKGNEKLTVRIAVSQLENKELDDETADVYRQALSNYADLIKD